MLLEKETDGLRRIKAQKRKGVFVLSSKADYLRVPITMPEEMFAYLERLSIRAKMSGGRKLANTQIVRAAVRALEVNEVDVSGCKDEEDVLAAIIRSQGNNKYEWLGTEML